MLALVSLRASLDPQFVVSSGLLIIVTYATLPAALSLPTNRIELARILPHLRRIVSVTLLIEGAIGIVQAVHAALLTRSFDLANGDRVHGPLC